MPVRVKIEVEGKAEFDRFFLRFDREVSDLRPVWADVRDEFWQIEREQFASEGRAGASGRWKSLTKKYAEYKQKRYGAKPILEATGRLKASLTGRTADTVYNAYEKYMEIGTGVPYARYHYLGKGRLPERKPISLSEPQKRRLAKRIQSGLVRELRLGNSYAVGD